MEMDYENGYFDVAHCRCRQRRKYGLVTLSHAPYNKSVIMPVQEAGKLQRKTIYCIVYVSTQVVISIEVGGKKINCDFKRLSRI